MVEGDRNKCCEKCHTKYPWTTVGHYQGNYGYKICSCFKFPHDQAFPGFTSGFGWMWWGFRCDYRWETGKGKGKTKTCKGGGCPDGTWKRRKRDVAQFRLSRSGLLCGAGWQAVTSPEDCEEAALVLDHPYMGDTAPASASPGCVFVGGHMYFTTSNGTAGNVVCEENLEPSNSTATKYGPQKGMQQKRTKHMNHTNAQKPKVKVEWRHCWGTGF